MPKMRKYVKKHLFIRFSKHFIFITCMRYMCVIYLILYCRLDKKNYLSSTVLKKRYEDFKKVIHSRDFAKQILNEIIHSHYSTTLYDRIINND